MGGGARWTGGAGESASGLINDAEFEFTRPAARLGANRQARAACRGVAGLSTNGIVKAQKRSPGRIQSRDIVHAERDRIVTGATGVAGLECGVGTGERIGVVECVRPGLVRRANACVERKSHRVTGPAQVKRTRHIRMI